METRIPKSLVDAALRILRALDGTRDRMNVLWALMAYRRHRGPKALAALERFIAWAEERNKPPGWIAAQVGHDLNIAADPTASPRTAGY